MRFGLRAAPGRLVQRLFIRENSPEPIRHVSRDSACFSACRRVLWITRSAVLLCAALVYPQKPLRLGSARFQRFRSFFPRAYDPQVITLRWTFLRSTARSDKCLKPSTAFFSLISLVFCAQTRTLTHNAGPPCVALVYPQNPLRPDSAYFLRFLLFFCTHVILRVIMQRWTFLRNIAHSDEYLNPSPAFFSPIFPVFPCADAYFGFRAPPGYLVRRLFIRRNSQGPIRRVSCGSVCFFRTHVILRL